MPRVDSVLQSRPRSQSRRILFRLLPLAAAALFGIVLVVGSGAPAQPAAAVEVSAVDQCNGVDNQGGRAVDCDVTVTNSYDVATDTGSSTVSTKACSGFANAPLTYLCTTDITTVAHLTTSITQCNGSGNGSGGTVTCTAHIVNLITGASEGTTAATVNACIGSGTGGGADPLLCDPIDSTTNATITQCNEAGNGGGSTARVKCSVTPSTITSAMPPVSINQCVGSGNGGGGFVTCTASIVTTLLPGGGEGDTTGTTTTGTTTAGTTTGTTTTGTTTAGTTTTTTTGTAGTSGTTGGGTVTSGTTVTEEATTPGVTSTGTTTAGTTTTGTTTSGTTATGAHPGNLASTGLDPAPTITLGVIAGLLGGLVLVALRGRRRTR